MLSTQDISRLKREAKAACSADPLLSHCQALDQIAQRYGFQNWSVLQKNGVTASSSTKPETPKIALSLLVSPEALHAAMATVPDTNPYLSAKSAEEIAESRLVDIHLEFSTPLHAVEFAIRYIETLLTFPKVAKSGAYTAYYQMRRWLPYYAQPLAEDRSGSQILVNRHYKPVGFLPTGDWVRYNDFPWLHTHLTSSELILASGLGCGTGYLYHDGSRPWSSKKSARAYLTQLIRLRSFLMSNP